MLVGVLAVAGGCAQPERKLVINSEPAGALVYLNGEEVGRTPLEYDFTWYSDYDVTLRKEGYETLKTNRSLKPPLKMWIPFDLFTEMHETDEWQAALETNGWADNFATGEEFEDFLVEQDARVAETLEELGLA